MKTKKLSTYFGVFAASMMVFSACGAQDSSNDDLSVESFMPTDMAVMIKVDYSDDSQKDGLETILSNFPETGAKAMMIAAYDGGAPEDLKYETAIQPIVSADWTLGIGMKFDEGYSINSLETGDLDGFEGVFVMEFEEADKVEELIMKLNEEMPSDDLMEKEEDGVKYWISENDQMYLARMESFYVVSVTEENLNSAIARAKNGEGFVMSEDLVSHDAVNENALYSMYMNMPVFSESFAPFYDELGLDIEELAGEMGDAFISVSAEDDGFRFAAVSEYGGGNQSYDLYADGYEFFMADKVPGQNIVIFGEEANLGIGLEQTLLGLSSISTVDPTFPVIPSYDELLAQFSGISGVSEEDLDAILSSPVSVVMDVQGVFPTFSFYVDLEDGETTAAEELMVGLDEMIGQMLVEVNQNLEVDFGPQAVKFENMGDGVRRVYFDGIPEEFFTELEDVFPEISTLKLEAYYGVNEDNLMFISFYPDFLNVYGEYTVSDDAMYQDAVDSLGDYDAASVYFAVTPLMEIVDKAVNIAKGMGEVSEADYAAYSQAVAFVEPFKYFVGSLKVEDGMIIQENFLKIGE